MRYITLLFLMLIIVSCSEDANSPKEKSLLYGKWDAYYGISSDGSITEGFQYAVLFNYEHGFELFSEGAYKSRYANDINNFNGGLHTDKNGGLWQVTNETLIFSYTFEGKTTTYHFTILSVDATDLKIKLIGIDDFFDEATHRTLYLKRSK